MSLSFFGLTQSYSYLVRTQTAEEIKKYAWLGDSFLNYTVSMMLHKRHPNETKGNLTELRKLYSGNKAMTIFLGTQNIRHSIDQANNHSQGTIFEWLLWLTYIHCGEHQAKSTVENYMNHVDENLDKYIDDVDCSNIDESDEDKSIDDDNSTITPGEEIDLLRKQCERAQSMFAQCETALAAAEKRKQHEDQERALQELLEHKMQKELQRKQQQQQQQQQHPKHQKHTGVKMEVCWRSRKKFWWTHEYYSCCGLQCGDLDSSFRWRVECPGDQQRRHSGVLQVHSGGRQGQGRHSSGGSTDHVPVCRDPRWSCCGGAARDVGCCARHTDTDIADTDTDIADTYIAVRRSLSGHWRNWLTPDRDSDDDTVY